MPKIAMRARSLNLLAIAAILAAAPLAASSPANAAAYTFTTIDVPGAASTSANGINNAGQIVGTFDTSGPNARTSGFVYPGGNFTIFDAPGSATIATGINDAGHIVGFVQTGPAGIGDGFLYSGSSFTSINAPGAGYTNATGINDAGQIVGFYDDGMGGQGHGFQDTGGSFTSIDIGGPDNNTEAFGINNLGQIVGTVTGPPHSQGFLETSGSLNSINFPSATGTWAYGINDLGQIVGFFGSGGGLLGFLDTSGSFTTIEVPGEINTQAFGINDAGQIVGIFQDRTTGDTRGFLATPISTVAEPSAFTLLFTGLLGFVLCVLARWRHGICGAVSEAGHPVSRHASHRPGGFPRVRPAAEKPPGCRNQSSPKMPDERLGQLPRAR
jgi:probable HAF family extracellular repeat protein